MVRQTKIQSIDPAWNHFNIVKDNTKLTHFSHVRSQPWRNPSHPLTRFWYKWLREAVHHGDISRLELSLKYGEDISIEDFYVAYYNFCNMTNYNVIIDDRYQPEIHKVVLQQFSKNLSKKTNVN